MHLRKATRLVAFQSLLGFLMRCDLIEGRSPKEIQEFQSLLGFLMRCDMLEEDDKLIIEVVSIPAGFSDALRRGS